MPAEVYGWAPLAAVTDGRWRYIAAPRPELYDLAEDPGELANRVADQPDEAARLRAVLEDLASRPPAAAVAPPQLDAETRAALLALGYLEAAAGAAHDALDPKDGIALLADFARAKGLLSGGNAADAILDGLVTRNPSNVPFLSRLAEAQLAAGDGEAALATIDRTLALRPRSEFLELARADALRRSGRSDEAQRAFRSALEIDPRHAPAWLGLAGLAGSPQEKLAVLIEAVAAGADSVVVLLEAARLDSAAGRTDQARALLERAAALVPEAAVGGLALARLEPAAGRLAAALAAGRRAAEAEPANPETALCSGRIYLARGEPARARSHLQRAAVLGRGAAVEAEAKALLESIAN
jgi:tetratricopeptide (TPR) repeat protein